MKIWHVRRPDNDPVGYDEYDSCVVVAKTEEAARLVHPADSAFAWDGKVWRRGEWTDRNWPAPNTFIVREVGTANDGEIGCICASFIAG